MKDRDRIDIRHGARGTRYRVRWTDDAGRHSRTFPTEAEARAFLSEIELKQLRQTYRTPDTITVGEVITEHIERSEGRVQPSTIRGWHQYLRDHVPASLKRRRVMEVQTRDWQRWVDSLSAKGLKPGTVQPVVSMVMGALNAAVRMGSVETNTLRGVQLPTIRQKGMTVWTHAETAAMLRTTRPDPKWHLVYTLGLFTGMRPGELRAVQWDDIRDGVLHVRRTVAKRADQGVTVRDGTKRGKGRHIRLAAPVLDALERWREVAPQGPYLWGEKPLPNMSWHRQHTALCEEAGVPRITLHEIRHTYATLQLQNGVHPKIVSEVLGHSKIEITLDLYTHVSTSMQESAAELLATSLLDATTDD